MDDARLERLLTRPDAPPARPKKRTGFDGLDSVYDEADGPMGFDLLKTRPTPSVPRERRPVVELSPFGNPLPAHGTDARYKHHGCRCDECVDVHHAATLAYEAANPWRKSERQRRARRNKREAA